MAKEGASSSSSDKKPTFKMNLPLNQILEDDRVQRTICLIVQAELEEANKCVAEKVERIRLSEEENFFLKKKIVELERENMKKEVELRGLRRQLQNEKARFDKARVRGQGQIESPALGATATPVRRMLTFTPSRTNYSSQTVTTPTTSTIAVKDGETNQHYQDPRKDGWICVCGTEFGSRQKLKIHTTYYEAGHQFSCTRCPIRFVSATDMRKHLKTVHKVEPDSWMKYGCRLCGRFFWKITELLMHRKTFHSSAKTKTNTSRSNRPRRTTTMLKRNGSSGVSQHLNPKKDEGDAKSHGFGGVMMAVVPATGKFKRKLQDTKGKTGESDEVLHSRRRFVCHCGKSYYAMRELKRHVKKLTSLADQSV